MITLRQWSKDDAKVPLNATWLVEDLGRATGTQEMFTKQSPQKLAVLREHALVESAQSSNRIEGVEVDPSRIGTVVFGSPIFRDRDEEEVNGYRRALDLIHSSGPALAINEETIRQLHRLARGDIWDAGKYKERAEPIIEHRPNQPARVRFMPVEAGPPTEAAMAELVSHYRDMALDGRVSPLLLIGGVVLDFLCIHPLGDGNGRTSRLLALLLCYHGGAEVGRYISLERLIEQNKARYYETLEISSAGWHEGHHNPWPFVNYVLWILKQAYAELEQRVGDTALPLGTKAELVREAIARQEGSFRVADLEGACPTVGRDWIRSILRQMKADNELQSSGRGVGARWQRINKQ